MRFFSPKFENEYTLGKRICNGVTCQIRECRSIKEERDYVVKIYPSDLDDINTIRYEHHLYVKNKLNSIPNILKLKDCYFDKYYVYYVMEKYEGKDLFATIMDGLQYSEHDLATFFRQIFRSLRSLHSLNIVHRNISGKNLVFARDDRRVLLLKGLRYMLSTNEYSKFNIVVEHSLQYLSPEIISQDTNLLNITKSDIWACGVILYTLLFGTNLFPIEFPFDKYTQNIVKGEINWNVKSPLLDYSNKLAIDFCKSLLKLNPDERITAKDALFHPWLSIDNVDSHNKQLAPERFYAEVRNSIDELDTLEENTFIQYRHRLNDDVLSRSGGSALLNKLGSTLSLSSRSIKLQGQKPQPRLSSKCLPFKIRKPAFRMKRFGSKRQDTKPLIENQVVEK
ncbi:protein kinase [Theileria orientalis]|uniref:Protein kinase n=1 Tax=Theileria orientalis TaxID=68886 RepID=A0A976MA54_THEOR|nr:protein kinase [Theileria orientalis]